MSLLSRIKDMGKSQDNEEVQPEALASPEGPSSAQRGAPDTQADNSTLQPADTTSIISEAAPSEFPPDYHEQRMAAESGAVSTSQRTTGLPFIGQWGLGRQQRMLFAAFVIGLLGLMLSAFFSINSADRRAAQAAATGQALMQSQRLAKSVSQALIGRAPAFLEVDESAKVLASNV